MSTLLKHRYRFRDITQQILSDFCLFRFYTSSNFGYKWKPPNSPNLKRLTLHSENTCLTVYLIFCLKLSLSLSTQLVEAGNCP